LILKLKTEEHHGLSHCIDHGSDLTRLNVDVPSGTNYIEIAGYLQGAQLGAGTLGDESTVWLYIDSLTRAVTACADVADTDAFVRLVDHARVRGWLDPSGTKMRVRLVYY
jgi:hypothetical protein